MNRWVAVVAIAVLLSPLQVHAQSTIFTVTVPSAGIRQSPNSGSPVVGYKKKGETLDVRREVGSWVEVTWPAGSDRVAYVSVNMGSIANSASQSALPPAPTPRRPMTIAEFVAMNSPATALAPTSATPATASATCSCVQPTATSASATRASVAAPAMQPLTTYVIPKHSIGIGGLIHGATRSMGGTGRIWTRKRIGVQVEFSREARTNGGPARLTSQQVASSVLYAPPSHVGDFVWLRPYAGGGTTFYRSTLNSGTLAVGETSTDHALGLQVFGGGELTFAAAPRFAVSADIGYHKWPASFASFEPRKLGIKVSGHWYVR